MGKKDGRKYYALIKGTVRIIEKNYSFLLRLTARLTKNVPLEF
jgi:hypothetical protein